MSYDGRGDTPCIPPYLILPFGKLPHFVIWEVKKATEASSYPPTP